MPSEVELTESLLGQDHHAGEGDGSSPEEPESALRGQIYIGLGNMVVSGSQQDRSISLA